MNAAVFPPNLIGGKTAVNQHPMSNNTKLPIKDILPIAQTLVERLRPFCQRIEIAGSLRRKRPQIGDIEIVAIPHYQTDMWGNLCPDKETPLDRFLTQSPAMVLHKNGAKYKSFAQSSHKIDLFLTLPSNWGNIFAIRTGSSDFSRWLVTPVSWAGAMPIGMRQKDGYLWRGETRIDCPEESDLFAALGLPFIPLEDRDDGRWEQYIRP